MSTSNATALNPVEASIHSAELAQLLKASADTLRVDILHVLSTDSYSVQELCTLFDLKQSAMSHHLKVLAASDLVTTRREGNTIFYRRSLLNSESPLAQFQAALFKQIDHCSMDASLKAGIKAVERQRIASSDAFFHENAAKFREQQDLIASFEQYGEGITSLLESVALPHNTLALEIGPGEGLFLPELSARFEQVKAFDTSPIMLEHSGNLCEQQGLSNINLYKGDTRVARESIQAEAACIVINMVLHHVANPADLFTDISQMLSPSGALIVTDLCRHDHDWARESCGDVWLGFEPEDLTHWANHAGLAEGQSTFLAQRNGFRIQIRHFIKEDNA